MSQWQPIETAPRDDTVLVAIVATKMNKAFAGQQGVQPVYLDEAGRICCLTRLKPDVGIANGMWEATHWQPLPPPPEEGT